MSHALRLGLPALAAAALLLLGPAGAAAGIKTVTFDPQDGFPAGTVMGGQVSGVSFADGPVVFDPQNTSTFSEPNALRSSRPCDAGCHRMRIDFPGRTSFVSLRVGVDSVKPFEFPIEARMEAYGAAGNLLQSTGNVEVATHDRYGPIVQELQVNRFPSSDVAYVIVFVGKADSGPPLSPNSPVRVDVDHLSFDAPGEGGGDPPVRVRPPAPRIAITDPPSGTAFAEGPTVSGTIEAPGGVHAFCVATNAELAMPATCSQVTRVLPERDPTTAATHVFTNVPVAGLGPGANRVTAWVQDNHTQLARSATVTITIPTGLDLSAENLEVTQGVQRLELPVPTARWIEASSDPDRAGSGAGVLARYNGVPLAQGKPTFVRFYADATFAGPRPSELRNVRAQLHVFEEAATGPRRRLGVLNPYSAGPRFAQPFDLPVARAAADGAFTFVLPQSWTSRGPLTLVGSVNQAAQGVRECSTCRSDNAFAVSGVRFTPLRQVDVTPVEMEYRGRGDLTDFVAPFREVRRFLPAPLRVHPVAGTIDTTGEDVIETLMAQLEEWDQSQPRPAAGKVVGMRPGSGAGLAQLNGRYTVTPTDFLRALVAHEVFHTLGLQHAGTDPACYGAPKDRPTDWPEDADQRGLIEAVGLDTDVDSGGPGLFQPLATRETGIFESPRAARAEWFDLMSYCSGEDDAWLSAINWTRLVEGLAAGGNVNLASARPRALATAARAAGGLRVSATVDEQGRGRILRVAPAGGTASPAAASPYRFVVRDAAGAVVSSTGVAPVAGLEEVRAGGRVTARGQSFFTALVPGRGAASVTLERDGTEVARATRSPSRPTVRLLAPRRGRRIGSRGRFTVAWRAADRDRDRLRVAVDYSANGGRTWRALTVAARGSSVRLPASLLTRSTRGRIRVRASDGFNQGEALSGPIRAAGRPPAVEILEPARRATVNSDARILLEGQAFDDAGRALRGRALRWLSGRRTLGFGARIAPYAGAIGRRVTLEARDRFGRRSRTSVAVRVRRVAPAFVVLSGPRRLSRTAGAVTLRVAATVPGRLSAGGRSVAVGQTVRRVRLPVPRRAGVTRLRVRLSAFGRSTSRTVTIRRS